MAVRDGCKGNVGQYFFYNLSGDEDPFVRAGDVLETANVLSRRDPDYSGTGLSMNDTPVGIMYNT